MVVEPIEKFARGAHTGSNVLKQTKLATKILEFVEPALVLRDLCFDYELEYLSTTVPVDEDDGNTMALEMSEGSRAPIFRSVMGKLPIALKKVMTNIFMTMESEIEDFNGDLYTREQKKAGHRMARKTDYDISEVLSGATSSVSAQNSGKLDTFDISNAKTELEVLGFEATVIVMNPKQFSDIEGEASLQSIDYTSEEAKVKGYKFQEVSGLRIKKSSKVVAGTAYVVDGAFDPIWFCFNRNTKTETYVEEGVGRGAIVTAFQNVLLIRPKAICKITGC